MTTVEDTKYAAPLDFYSVEDFDDWLENYQHPISGSQKEEINRDICTAATQSYRDLDNERLKAYFRIASKSLIKEIFNLIMRSVYVSAQPNFYLNTDSIPGVKRPQNNQIVVVRDGDPSRYEFPMLTTVGPVAGRSPYSKGLKEKLIDAKAYARKILSFAKNNPATISLNPRSPHKAVMLNDATHRYLQMKGIRVFQLNETRIFKDGYELYQSSIGNQVKAMVDELIARCQKIAEKHQVSSVIEPFWDVFRDAVTFYFYCIEKDFEDALTYFGKSPFNCYSGTAKYICRLISEVARWNGGQAVGTPHDGGWAATSDFPQFVYGECATVDKYISGDPEVIRGYQNYDYIHPIEFELLPDLEASLFGPFPKRKSLRLDDVKTIMYVEGGYEKFDLFRTTLAENTLQYHTQLRILDLLLKLEKKILFKNRPKTAAKANDFDHFGRFDEKLEYTIAPFVDVIQKTDLFVFEIIMSKALFEAMTLTDTPIILFYTGQPTITPEFEKILNERCFVIYLEQNSQGTFDIDENKFWDIFD